MKQSLVSIIVPVYNRAHWLPRTLASLEAQTYQPLEIVLVDNASTDASWTLMQQWQAERTSAALRVTLCREPRPGAAIARNTGARVAQGTWLSFFDSDDEMSPTFVAEMVQAVQASSLPEAEQWATCRTRMQWADGRTQVRWGCPQPTLAQHIIASVINTQCCLLHRQLWERVGGWCEDLTLWDDYELGARLLLHAPRPAWCARVFHTLHQHSQSLTGTPWPQQVAARQRVLHCLYKELLRYEPAASSLSDVHPATLRALRALALRIDLVVGELHRAGLGAEAQTLQRELYRLCPLLPSGSRVLQQAARWGVRGLWRIALWWV